MFVLKVLQIIVVDQTIVNSFRQECILTICMRSFFMIPAYVFIVNYFEIKKIIKAVQINLEHKFIKNSSSC